MGYAITQPIDLSGSLAGLARESTPNRLDRLDALAPWFAGRDLLFWPCMSGESLPPTFSTNSGSAFYSSILGQPSVLTSALAFTSGGSRFGDALWPIAPRAQGDRVVRVTKFAIVFTANGVAVADPEEWAAIGPGVPATPTGDALGGTDARAVVLRKPGAGTDLIFATGDGVGAESSVVAVAPALNAFIEVEIREEAAAAVCLINDVEQARHVTRFPSLTSTTRLRQRAQGADISGSQPPAMHAAAISIEWEEPS